MLHVKAQTSLLVMREAWPIRKQKGVGRPLGSLVGKQEEAAEKLGLDIKDQVTWKYSLNCVGEDQDS